MSNPGTSSDIASGWLIQSNIFNTHILKKALSLPRYQIGNEALAMMDQKAFRTFIAKEKSIRLVIRSLSDLGFEEGAEYQHFCSEVIMQGYRLCPAEAGPRVRKFYGNQSEGEVLRIAMTPILLSDGEQYIFALDHEKNKLRLDGDSIYPDDFFEADKRFVLVLPTRSFFPADPQ